jgi:hypothetical protein
LGVGRGKKHGITQPISISETNRPGQESLTRPEVGAGVLGYLRLGLDYRDYRSLGRSLLLLIGMVVLVGMSMVVALSVVVMVAWPVLVNVGQTLGLAFLSAAITHVGSSVLETDNILCRGSGVVKL